MLLKTEGKGKTTHPIYGQCLNLLNYGIFMSCLIFKIYKDDETTIQNVINVLSDI